MKTRLILILFAAVILSLGGCRSQEVCPAYSDATLEQLPDENPALPNG